MVALGWANVAVWKSGAPDAPYGSTTLVLPCTTWKGEDERAAAGASTLNNSLAETLAAGGGEDWRSCGKS